MKKKDKPIQKSLSNYLKRPKNDNIPRYFHFDGEQCIFLSSLPPKNKNRQEIIEIAQIKWNYTKKYLVLTSTSEVLESSRFTKRPSYPDNLFLPKSILDQWTPQEEIEIIALLKSHLQKAVRLGQKDHAMATVNYLATIAPIDLLRRIPIIMVEDVHLQESFPLLIWLMVYYSSVSPGSRQISTYWINFLQEVVKQLCDSSHQDHFTSIHDPESPPPISLTEIINPTNKTNPTNTSLFTPSQESLLLSLQLRKSYGGMKGDQNMLDSLTIQWYHRFKVDLNEYEWITKYPSPHLSKLIPLSSIIKSLPPLSEEHFLNAAVDFHPCPWLIKNIVKKYPNLDPQEVKIAIWQCRSSINFRNDNIPSNHSINIWGKIQDIIRDFTIDKKRWLFNLLYPL